MYDIYGLGNALVDTEYMVEESFLRDQNVDKGLMTMIDADRLQQLNDALHERNAKRMSGGSAANSMYAAQGFGAQTFYSCKVGHDPVGEHFIEDLTNAGVRVNPNAQGAPGRSGESLILITPDADRSMNTYLGISTQLSSAEIDESALRTSRYFYFEGYLSANESSYAAAVAGREIAESAGVKTCVSLSDPSMVAAFREPLEAMLGNGVHQIFCNEEEALSWAHTDRMDIAIAELKDIAQVLSITLGAKGSLSVVDGHQKAVPGVSVKPTDTTGAGDIYAGAYLAMVAAGADAIIATRFANHCAGYLVTEVGPRLRGPSEYQALKARFTA